MEIEVYVKLDNSQSYIQRIHVQDEVPVAETENVLHHAFKEVIRDIAKLREVK